MKLTLKLARKLICKADERLRYGDWLLGKAQDAADNGDTDKCLEYCDLHKMNIRTLRFQLFLAKLLGGREV
jgi:hypothetical protein